MTEPPVPRYGTTSTLPPPSANGSSPPSPAAPAQVIKTGRTRTRISGMRTGLIAGAFGLVVVMIFIIQNAHAVNVSFLGAHTHLSLAVALLIAAIAGALLMAAAGTARITQLRRIMRRDRRKPARTRQMIVRADARPHAGNLVPSAIHRTNADAG